MSKPFKAGPMECARCLFEKQELDESIAEWQQQDEDQNIEAIFKHEIETTKPEDMGRWFHNELKRRDIR